MIGHTKFIRNLQECVNSVFNVVWPPQIHWDCILRGLLLVQENFVLVLGNEVMLLLFFFLFLLYLILFPGLRQDFF